MDRNNQKQEKKLCKCVTANTSAIWQQAAHTTYHLLSAQEEPHNKSLMLNEKLRIFWRKKEGKKKTSGEWTISRKMTTRQKESRGLGRKTKEEIGKRNQMTALRFQTGEEKHQISPASLQGNSLYFDKLISQCENRACAHFSIP